MFKNLRARKEEGFTLIELLITVVILAVLMGIAIPIYVNNKNSADSAAAKSEVHEVAVAISGGIATGDLATSAGALAGVAALPAGAVLSYQGAKQSINGATVWINSSVVGSEVFCVSEGGWKATESASVALGAACIAA